MKNPSVNSIVERLPELPDNHADFTPNLAMKIMEKYREIIGQRDTIISELQAEIGHLKLEHQHACQEIEVAIHEREAARSSLSRIKAETIEALRPFADALRGVDDAAWDHWPLWDASATMGLNVGNLRRAASAIRSLGSTGGMDSEKTGGAG